MNNLVFENEIKDDLQINNLHIIQKKDGFKFGTDAVLLSDFAKKTKAKSILDLCTGSGVIPILMSAKSKAKNIWGLEINEETADMASRSVSLNCLEEKIKIVCGDLKNSTKYFTPHSFEAVTINPPYMKANTNVLNEHDLKTIARHEVLCNIDDCMEACAKMLTFKGELYMVHRPNRLSDIITAMKNNHIEPKLLRFVHSTQNAEPSMLLILGTYHGGIDLKILPPLFLYNDDGSETAEMKKIYGKE